MTRLLHHIIVVAPFLLQAIKDEVDAPASLFADLVEDAEDFILLGTVGEAFTSYM